MMRLLEYEKQIMLDLYHEDCLVIMGKGLGIERILMSLITIYSDPGNLVLIIGTTPQEEEYIIKELAKTEMIHLPKTITNECGTNERHEIYLQGGVLFVTSRILVVDMLMNRVPFEYVTGMIVYKAHKTIESCQEAFILRLYRQNNKKGFVKALTGSPWSFTMGFCQVQRIMRNLFVRKLHLWPRFHAVISSSFENCKPEVTEIHVTLTPAMKKIQLALLDIMAITVKEIKKINPTIDTDEVTVENVISKSFDKIIRHQLDPVWHQLGSKTKRLINDLKTLRVLLNYLCQYDSVTFYNLIKSIRETVKINTQVSEWLFLDQAEMVFQHAKERVFGAGTSSKPIKKAKTDENDCDIEINPKWIALSDIVKDLESQIQVPETLLIIVSDDRTSGQLKQYLEIGPKGLLNKLYNQSAKEPMIPEVPLSNKETEIPKIKYNRLSRKKRSPQQMTLTQIVDQKLDSHTDDEVGPTSQDSECENQDKSEGMDSSKLLNIVYYVLTGSYRPFGLKEELEKLKPSFVLMYDAEIGIVRQLEVYQALNPEKVLKIFFLIYGGATEEQKYLTALRREKEAFEFLIKEKNSMVVPEDRDGKTDNHPDLVRGTSKANETASSRKAGGAQQNCITTQLVIVDVREFRSELPSLIHKLGIDIEPLTIEVGDYILTPDTCVERKSINDLVGSLNSGRLYNQAKAMCRYYQRPMLLIEFDHNKSFSLQGKYFSTLSDSSTSLMSKLVLLTIHFPRLRILWCPSPYATADMFELLKRNKDQPSAAQVLSVTNQATVGELAIDKYNVETQTFLTKLPGITSKNVYSVMNKVTNIMELMLLSEEQLNEILNNSSNAKALWEALHLSAAKNQATIPSKNRNRFMRGKKTR